jgi:hypothetical protein
MNESKVNCPGCGVEIDVNSILSDKLDEQYKQKYQEQIHTEREKFKKQQDVINKEREDLDKAKLEWTEELNQKVNEKLKSERDRIIKETKSKLEEEQSQAISELNTELKEKTEKLKELNRFKTEIERLKREKDELKDSIAAEMERDLNERIKEERIKIKQAAEENSEFQIKELKKQLEDQKKLTEEMKRKQEQGSMQLQGEVMELAIEEWLKSKFPLDSITEIKKGDRGADCIQVINTYSREGYGTIYYESKRTKNFDPKWISKLKEDMRAKNANIAVLVTDVYPKDIDRMALVDGIWICSYPEFKGLCTVLRESLIQLGDAIISQENKGEKMIMLYEYLVGNEFRSQVEAIVEGFTQMQADLITEKRSIEGHWKKREKQIEKVLRNTTFMYSSIRGIAGASLQPIKNLELPESTNDIDEES